jgi:hypothetical protein
MVAPKWYNYAVHVCYYLVKSKKIFKMIKMCNLEVWEVMVQLVKLPKNPKVSWMKFL